MKILLQQRFNPAPQLFGARGRCMAADDPPLAIHQKFGEVPVDPSQPQQSPPRALQQPENRMRTRAIHFDLREHRELHPVIPFAEDRRSPRCCRAPGARTGRRGRPEPRSRGPSTARAVFQPGVLRCETAAAGGVRNQQNASRKMGKSGCGVPSSRSAESW